MPAFNSTQFRGSVVEAALWCRLKTAGISAPDEIRRRHALYVEAEQRWGEARQSARERSLRVADTKEWHEAMALFQQIRDLTGLIAHQLRSPELKPSFDIDELREDGLWSKAVAEVAAKRSVLIGQSRPDKDEMNGECCLMIVNTRENL